MEVDIGQIKLDHGFNDEGEFIGSQVKSGLNLTHKENNILQNNINKINFTAQSLTNSNTESCTTIKRMKIPKTFITSSTPFNQNQRYLVLI